MYKVTDHSYGADADGNRGTPADKKSQSQNL